MGIKTVPFMYCSREEVVFIGIDNYLRGNELYRMVVGGEAVSSYNKVH